MRTPLLASAILTAVVTSNGGTAPRPHALSPQMKALADSFYAITSVGQDDSIVWPDLSDSTRIKGDRRLDAVAEGLHRVPRTALSSADDQLLHDNLAEVADATVASRVCRYHLWANTNQFSGWHVAASDFARVQPASTEITRERALFVMRGAPAAMAAERALLARGLDSGYTASAPVIRTVLRQLDDLLPDDVTASPLYAPAERSGSPEFASRWKALLADTIYPAARDYRAFLEREYLPHARAEGSMATQRDGTSCYTAGLRAQTSVQSNTDSVMRDARAEFDRLVRELAPLVAQLTGERDVVAGMRALRTDPRFSFHERSELLPAYQSMTSRAESRLGRVVAGIAPEPIVVTPYPEFQEKAGLPPSYIRAPADGSRPAQFMVNLSRMERMSVADAVAHEGYPGHHLQRIAEVRAPVVHPVMRTLFVGGFIEGWGIYAEELADEMGLYTDPLYRAGYLIHLADVAMACYLDIGYHTRGWTRQNLVDSMTTLAGRATPNAEAYADRHAATPGQIATYYIGYRAIRAYRDAAKQRLGKDFHAPQFHYQVLRDGTITLASLGAKLARWDGRAE